MSSKTTSQSRLFRFCLVGAIVFGLAGFSSGVALCLYFKLPIPPLFLTEMGVLVGGCLGGLMSYVDLSTWLTAPRVSSEDGWETYRG